MIVVQRKITTKMLEGYSCQKLVGSVEALALNDFSTSASVENVSAWLSWHRTAYTVCIQWMFSKMAPGWRRGDKLLNKVVFFSFAHKKYYRSFVKLWLNPWCHVDYFTDLLATFLDLDRVRTLAVYGRVRELTGCIKNILICVLKMNGGLTGLERREGE